MRLGLDLAAGCKVAIDEMYGDWYRDPWGWPEFRWLAGKPDALKLETFVRKASEGHVLSNPAAFHLFDVPKNRLALRPAVVLDSMSRLLYAAAVASKVGALHRELPDWVFGWRTRDGKRFSKNQQEWSSYMKAFPEDTEGLHGLQVDIASCFASINVDRLCDTLYQRLGKSAATDIVSDIVRRHNSLVARSGIPQRSYSSAALAHLYFQPIDDTLTMATDNGIPFVTRWMDDISAVGSEERLYGLYLNLQDRAGQLGLTLNAAKSRLISAGDVVGFIREENVREIPVEQMLEGEYGGFSVVYDPTYVLHLESQILSEPASFPRTKLRAVLGSLTRSNIFDRWDDWLRIAYRIPHAADSLGRYLHAGAELDHVEGLVTSSRWQNLEEFIGDFANREWGKVDWVTAQLALAVPSVRMGAKMIEMMRLWLHESNDVQKVAIATQRLAAGRPVDCRDIIRRRLDRTSDPTLLRILGLGLLAAGDERSVIRAALERDLRNHLVLLMLEDTNWRAPNVAEDFDSHTE